MRRPLLLLALAAALVVPLITAASANAVILIGKGMAGVSIGMSQSRVLAIKGPPDARARPTHEIIGRYTRLRYGSVYVEIAAGSGVFNIYTRGRAERTAADVDFDSPLMRLAAGGRQAPPERDAA